MNPSPIDYCPIVPKAAGRVASGHVLLAPRITSTVLVFYTLHSCFLNSPFNYYSVASLQWSLFSFSPNPQNLYLSKRMNVVVLPGTFTREQKEEKWRISTSSPDLPPPSHLITKLILLLELLCHPLNLL